jgi:dTDP-4-amino-4,6-dideoxygalactose transaminase
MRHTLELSDRLVRLPLWVGLEEDQDQVIQHILAAAE